ncbi:hypothetical protein E1301_Tti012888 [Triplophysa tibetana]|uniref:Uncharacterized protein n=1 Tax=Triplophysa tibetana TaxID=1572043 RepID=A0A5A9P235_9TELE|nr:hypothetical protein E1301_Tti012888 [Triplophysa tibetana]
MPNIKSSTDTIRERLVPLFPPGTSCKRHRSTAAAFRLDLLLARVDQLPLTGCGYRCPFQLLVTSPLRRFAAKNAINCHCRMNGQDWTWYINTPKQEANAVLSVSTETV